MRRDVEAWFSAEDNVEYWDSLYDQRGFSEDCLRRRMAVALSWLDASGSTAGKSLLEVGCGAGRLARRAAQGGFRVVGMDLSFAMLDRARAVGRSEAGDRPGFVQGEIDHLPLRDSAFDAAVCLGLISYLDSEKEALRELARVMKPGGLLVVSMYNRARLVHYLDVPLRLGNLLRRVVRRALRRSSSEGSPKDPRRKLRTFYLKGFGRSLQRAGFRVRGYEAVPLELITLFGREVLPRSLAKKITMLLERSSNIPFFETFGTMCVVRAEKSGF